MKPKWKRPLAFLLLAAMMLSLINAPVYAVEIGETAVSGLCAHHTEHDAACGYAQGTPCNHEHSEDCYALTENCVHTHDGDCYPEVGDGIALSDAAEAEPTACSHLCGEDTGCITKELNCQHTHDWGLRIPGSCALRLCLRRMCRSRCRPKPSSGLIPTGRSGAGGTDHSKPSRRRIFPMRSGLARQRRACFAAYAMQMLYGGGGLSLFGNYGESVLNETELAIYNELKTAVGKIAAGEVSDTMISITSDLGIESWVTTKSGDELMAEAAEKFNAAIDTDKNTLSCLLVDCPYELYWYNKTSGGGVRTNYATRTSTSTVDDVSTTTASIINLAFYFSVANAYQDDDDPYSYATDTAKTGAASAAVANAQAVITANEGKTDYAKLVAYTRLHLQRGFL